MSEAISKVSGFQRTIIGGTVAATVLCALVLLPSARAADPQAPEGASTHQHETAVEKHEIPATELIGSEVKNQNKEKVGEISDLIIDGEKGNVPFAVVDFAGALEFENELFAIPLKAFKHDHEGGTCVLNIEMMKESPGEEEKQQWTEVQEDEPSAPDKEMIGDYWVEAPSNQEGQPEHRSHALSANKILGAQIYNKQGEEVGTLSNLILDLEKNAITSTVFGTGGVLGIGEEKHLLPWKSFSHNREKGQLTADITKEKIESAPVYNEKQYISQDRSSRL